MTQPDAERSFGTTNLPIISAKDSCLVNLLVAYSHKVYLFDSYELNITKRATSAKLNRRPFVVFIDKADVVVNRYIHNCIKCNVESKRKYNVGMGLIYSGLATLVPPMS